MRWEELGEALEVLETEDSYGGYFYDIKDAVITAILGSLCELQSVKKIHTWAMSAPERTFLAEHFSITRIPCYWRLFSLLAMIKNEWVCLKGDSLFRRTDEFKIKSLYHNELILNTALKIKVTYQNLNLFGQLL